MVQMEQVSDLSSLTDLVSYPCPRRPPVQKHVRVEKISVDFVLKLSMSQTAVKIFRAVTTSIL